MAHMFHYQILRHCPQFADDRLQVTVHTGDLRHTLELLDNATGGRAYVSERSAIEQFLFNEEAARSKYSDSLMVPYNLLVNIRRSDLLLLKLGS